MNEVTGMNAAEQDIRFGTDLITFYNSAYWGLAPELTHEEWVLEFEKSPLTYLEKMLDLAQRSGLSGIEFAPEPATWDAALEAYGSAGAVQDAVSRRGLHITSAYAPGRQLIGKARGNPELAAAADDYIDRLAFFLRNVGARTIVIGNLMRSRFGNESPDDTATAEDFAVDVEAAVHEEFADHMNRLAAVAARHEVRLAIHTDAYSICSRPRDVDTVMRLTDPEGVGLCLDAGHVALDGEDPVEILRAHTERTFTMHWKDCTAPLPGHTLRGNQKARHAEMLKHFAVIGRGTVDWEEWMRVLREARWAGFASAEIDMAEDPVRDLREALAYYRDTLAPILGRTS